MPAKRIILLLDGTWNDKDDGLADTNIVRLQSIIAKSLSNPTTSPPSLDPNSRASQKVRGFTSQGLENIVLYQRGVGTGAFDRIAGGVFGWGVPGNVRHSYKFLSYHYEDGDQIFVFGFSRGAYTARSLIGYISAIGLLTRTHCTPENELLAWQFYRTDPQDRLPGVWAKLTPYVHNRETLRIKCVGVFDTVGALGVPTRTLWRFNRASNEFHNVELSSITDVDLHAIAIDEHRVPFEATAWHKPKFKQFATCTEQVWFPGAHADVGGGYIDEEKRDSNSIALDDITLDWMLQRLKSYFSDFPFEQDVWKIINKSWSVAQQHEPHSERMYRSTPLSLRSIANYAVENLCSNECNMGRYRHADTIGEMVHVSALERLGKTVQTDERAHRYEPKNLIQILSRHQSNLQRRRSSVDPARYSRRGLDGGNF
jgi:uncharacterized protein (DUF2235 family)